MSSPAPKTSFEALDLSLNAAALAEDVDRIPRHAWWPSYWPQPHGDVDFVLLRGGDRDQETDFFADEVSDRPLLATLPTLAALIGPDGPFGGATYAFLFRMSPRGRALVHRDALPCWVTMHRVHIPIRTHPDAALLVEGRAQHLPAGTVWTFDNQRAHGAINGPTVRTHLILDVPTAHPAMIALRRRSTVHPGTAAPTQWAAIGGPPWPP